MTRNKIYIKIVYVVFLTVILFFLLFVIYDKAGKRAHMYTPIDDYTIKDENTECIKGEELLYESKDYNYYLPCLSSYKIYLEWSSGDRDLVKNALNSGKVTIESLIEHGLKVEKHEK